MKHFLLLLICMVTCASVSLQALESTPTPALADKTPLTYQTIFNSCQGKTPDQQLAIAAQMLSTKNGKSVAENRRILESQKAAVHAIQQEGQEGQLFITEFLNAAKNNQPLSQYKPKIEAQIKILQPNSEKA